MIKPLLVILTLTNLVVILLLIRQFEYVDLKPDLYLIDSQHDFRNFEIEKSQMDEKIAKELASGLNLSLKGILLVLSWAAHDGPDGFGTFKYVCPESK